MARPIRTICVVTSFGLLLLLSAWCGTTVSADSCLGYPRCGGCATCVMNVREFGHYQTVWRRWPGTPRQAELFPRAIGREEVPTPEGQPAEQLPRTRLRTPEERARDSGVPGTIPGMPGTAPGMFPGEGGVAPGTPGLDFGPSVPEAPAEPGGGSLLEEPLVPGMPAGPGGSMDFGPPSDFEPPSTTPPSTMPGTGASLPQLTPPSVTAAEVPSERTLPEPAIVEPAFVEPVIANQTIAEPEIVEPKITAPKVAAPKIAATKIIEPTIVEPVVSEPGEAVAQETPQADVPEPQIASDASSEGQIAEAGDMKLPPPAPLNQPQAKPLRANWMAALNPGFRGEANRMGSSHSAVGSAVAVEPKEVPAGSTHVEQAVNYEQNVADESVAMPVALGGYCPVELIVNERWVQSNPRCSQTYQGRKYLFANEAQRQEFLKDPERFVPVHSGNDPVLLIDDKREVPGKLDYCVTYEGRLYMFSKTDTLARFQKNPQRYIAQGK